MGNSSSSDECPAELKQWIPDNVLQDLDEGHKALRAQAKEGDSWEVALIERHGYKELGPLTARLAGVQRGDSTKDRPKFSTYCEAYHQLMANPDVLKRTEQCLTLMAEQGVINLQSFVHDLLEIYGSHVPDLDKEMLIGALDHCLELDGNSTASVSYVLKAIQQSFHGLGLWLQYFCCCAFLGPTHGLASQMLQHLLPSLAGASRLLTPSATAFLALVMP
eukprot:CAMPEP_0174371068 /NCGR_PEP_ID=MMETSP0811_2-20130205/98407_1 /TAXON_ID=73025 ORGANISM="Eutreptiella gymnastica-like, Strain CCMP1594" /NCGR_SAMPLE_ID=MMETSP0811_2 /ASSEMBLY_ACC=CAM_ASM_000667 /LENGTH=219 /DNA_ID=CAMNT_0015517093 /DNA_START=41 /DNA_END=697 /DNA_ORIENTATION=+